MASSNAFFSFILCVFLLASLASAASPFLSYDIFESGTSRGRSLLQTQKACAVDFSHKDYSVLTGQCKGPPYLARVCCMAFKQFACPYTDVINDQSTDCAATMFDYINMYGKYPLGLFYENCKEGPEGLDCSKIVKPHRARRHGRHGRKHRMSKRSKFQGNNHA